MSRQPRVGIVVDHPTRDLSGATLLAHALAARGVAASLIPFYFQQIDTPYLDLDLIVLNYARPVNRAFAQRCHEAGIMVAVLDSEGGLLAREGPTSARGISEYVRASGFGDIIAAYLCWGEAMADALRAHSGLADDAIAVTGCPRFDFASNPWKAALHPHDERYILVNTNFPIINNRFAEDGLEDRLSLKAMGLSDDVIEQVVGECRAVRATMTEAIGRLAGDFPDRKFLVRPHPFERDAFYRECFADRPNVSVSHQGSSLEAIGGADAVLHVNCTTAVEALICGVLPVGIEYANQPWLRDAARLAGRVSRNVHDYEELARIVSDLDGATRSFDFAEMLRANIRPYFHLTDGLAHWRAADHLLSLLDKRAAGGARGRMTRRGRTLGQTVYAGLAALIGSRLTGKLRALLQARRRGKTFAVEEVTAMLRRLEEITGSPAARVGHARNGWGARLASIMVERPSLPVGGTR